jgi:hypothetical protein
VVRDHSGQARFLSGGKGATGFEKNGLGADIVFNRGQCGLLRVASFC